jgi:nucleotide-binding universal stress UspA family protein
LQGEDIENMLLLTQQDDYVLTVVSAPTAEPLVPFIRNAGTPVLLLFGDSSTSQTESLGHILLSLRGHSPDLSALDLAIPLAKQYQAKVTVLAVTGVPQSDRSALNRFSHSLAALLDPEQEPAQHLSECTNRLVDVGITGYLKLCQGDPIEQIVTEYAKGQYGLLVITSEAYGDFVQQVITNLQSQGQSAAVLVIRPTSAA